MSRLLERLFEKRAPRAGRVVLGGADPYGQINAAGAQLHEVLLNLALEHRQWIVDTDRARSRGSTRR